MSYQSLNKLYNALSLSLSENLIEIQNIAALELEQLERQGRVFRIAKKNVEFNSLLDEAWDKLENGRFTIGDFLK